MHIFSLKKFVLLFIIFLIIHFGALGFGTYLAGSPTSLWYKALNRAPWSPPGWVFGVAWTSIMLCLSIALALTLPRIDQFKRFFIAIIAFQWFFNVLWNPIFFRLHLIGLSLFDMAFLAIFVILIFRTVWLTNKAYSLLVLPYLIWICVATSLNVYIWLYN